MIVLDNYLNLKKSNIKEGNISGYLEKSKQYDYLTKPTSSLKGLPPATGDNFYS